MYSLDALCPIIAAVVGPTGHVIGIEIDSELASPTRENLAYLEHVEVLQGDGGEYDPGPSDAIFVNAGVTHPTCMAGDPRKSERRASSIEQSAPR